MTVCFSDADASPTVLVFPSAAAGCGAAAIFGAKEGNLKRGGRAEICVPAAAAFGVGVERGWR